MSGYNDDTIREWAEASRKGASNVLACLSCGAKFDTVEELEAHLKIEEMVTL